MQKAFDFFQKLLLIENPAESKEGDIKAEYPLDGQRRNSSDAILMVSPSNDKELTKTPRDTLAFEDAPWECIEKEELFVHKPEKPKFPSMENMQQIIIDTIPLRRSSLTLPSKKDLNDINTEKDNKTENVEDVFQDDSDDDENNNRTERKVTTSEVGLNQESSVKSSVLPSCARIGVSSF